MKELTTNDTGRPVLFLDAFTFVPAIGPDSDMDGHDLSSLTYSEIVRCEDWCDAFNEHYLDKAVETNFMGMPIILVKDFYDDEAFGELDDERDYNIPDEDKPDAFKAIVDSWSMFNLTPAEEEHFKDELKKKLKM